MKKIIILLVSVTASFATFAQEKAGKKDTITHAILYACPMHPDVTSDKPGKCAKCGMDLTLSPKERMKKEVAKNYTCPVHADVLVKKPGKCPKCGKDLILSPKERMKMEVVKNYTCPMHPDVVSDKPGKCPKCGMDMGEKKEKNQKNR
ncbi:MAG: hypothetical protein J0H85_04415 [Sediminibacterium magnilacihabitans]|jgi:hypothetical protein|nr:hypothetical protein [Sediminibacterium magnilacihabitans]PQV61857.1 hypothetical protein CLV53_101131 [Sediminibacterium magnilacihabitans]